MDRGTVFVAIVTLTLFVTALFVHGLTQEMLIEGGVFLVSVKLMIMAYQTHKFEERLDAKLNRILAAIGEGKLP